MLFSIVEYAIANWLMRMEARVQKARDKAEKAAAEALEAEPSPTSVAETNGEQAKAEPAKVEPAPEGGAGEEDDLSGVGSAEIKAAMIEQGESIEELSVPPEPKPRLGFKEISLRTKKPRDLDKEGAAVRKHLRGAERLFINSHGRLYFRDQHLDVACRYLYPIAYAIVLGVFYS